MWELIWGTTLGLAIAHWFAFQVSARMVAGGAVRSHDVWVVIAQLLGAVAVGVLASIPILVFPASVELDVVVIVLAGFLASSATSSPARVEPATDGRSDTRRGSSSSASASSW